MISLSFKSNSILNLFFFPLFCELLFSAFILLILIFLYSYSSGDKFSKILICSFSILVFVFLLLVLSSLMELLLISLLLFCILLRVFVFNIDIIFRFCLLFKGKIGEISSELVCDQDSINFMDLL